MKLNKLRIRNFRNITDTVLDLVDAKFCVIRGANRNGKTSVAEALSLALTPTTWGLSSKGDGYVRKIKRGETKSTLEAELQAANRTIRRTVSLNVNSTGRTQSSEDISDPEWHPAKFDNLLLAKKTALEISINTRAFQSLIYSGDEKAQKNLLAQLVLPAHYDFPKDTIATVESLIGGGTVNFDGEPFAVIEQAYKKLFSERQDVNRKIKEFTIPEPLPRPQGVDSESLKTKLTVLREERQKQSGERDGASKQANEEILKRERAKAKIDTLEAMLKASKEALQSLHGNILTDPSVVQEIAGRRVDRDRLVGQLHRVSSSQEAAKAEQVRMLEISKMGGACPTCDQDIDDSKIAKLLEANIAERTRLTEVYENVASLLHSLGDVDDAISKLDKHNKAVAEKSEAMAKIEENTKILDGARAVADGVFGSLFEPAKFDNAISKADKDIETILQQIQPVVAAEEREKDITAKKDQLKRLEDKAGKLDTLVKLFDKDGIKAKLISQYIGGFELKVNEILASWNYRCSLSIEPFKFEVTDYRNVSTPVIDLSGAEELMFYAAFQCAVSRTAGIGFVVIDKVDTLLPDLRPALYKNLYQIVKDGVLDQVLLLVADVSTAVPSLPDSAFFKIVEGVITRL